jgi:hypothetical protein
VANKFGIGQGGAGGGGLTVFGTPEYARAWCEASLRRLRSEELRETASAAPNPTTSAIACLQGRGCGGEGTGRGEDG